MFALFGIIGMVIGFMIGARMGVERGIKKAEKYHEIPPTESIYW